MAERLGILVINQISASGLSRLPAETYRVGKDVADPAAILVRSADLHETAIPVSVPPSVGSPRNDVAPSIVTSQWINP